MADFHIRSESVDVEQIMKQIRARIQEKRGVDYTEEQVRELASVRLEKFLDPKNLRSDLLEQFRRSRPAPPAIPSEPPPIDPPYVFDDQTIFSSHRGPLRFIRRLLKPLLMLFFNTNTLNHVLHQQAQFNIDMLKRDQRRKIEMQIFDRSRAEWNVLYYEVLHNLVLETTRNGIELKNLKMRVEALASRLDFSERRVRALEGVVQYRPEAVRQRPALREGQTRGDQSASRERRERERPRDSDTTAAAPADVAEPTTEPVSDTPSGPGATAPATAGESPARRRRRRRRGRRGSGMVLPGAAGTNGDTDIAADGGDDESFDGGDEGDAAEPSQDRGDEDAGTPGTSDHEPQ